MKFARFAFRCVTKFACALCLGALLLPALGCGSAPPPPTPEEAANSPPLTPPGDSGSSGLSSPVNP